MEVKGVGCFKDDYRDRVFNQLLATYRGRAMRTDQTIWRSYKASLTRYVRQDLSLSFKAKANCKSSLMFTRILSTVNIDISH